MSTVHEPAADEPPSREQDHNPSSGEPDRPTPARSLYWSDSGAAASSVEAALVSPAGHPWRSKNPFQSFRHAVEGVAHTFRTQRNMRFHFLAFVLVLFSGLLFRLSGVELLVLLFSASLVLVAEMFNTAVEAVVDMITQSYHPAAKFAKDIAAGAVLIASLNAVAVGAVLFLGSGRPQAVRLRLQEPPALYVFFAGVLLLFCVLMIWKIVGAKGTLLYGGVVSGHSAVAFFLATTILFFSGNWLVPVLAFLLAALVAQSRVEARIHTVQEVIIGAVLAIFLSAGIYRLPAWVARMIPADGGLPGVTRQVEARPVTAAPDTGTAPPTAAAVLSPR